MAQAQTKRALLWTSLLNESLFTLYGMLAFILRRDLGATAFEIAILTMLKPVVSIISFYFGTLLYPRHLLKNIVWTGTLARVPFLLFPFFHDISFFIFGAAAYTLFTRAGTPAWMEVIKLNLGQKERDRYFSLGSALGYAEGVALAIGLGWILDFHPSSWTWLFFLSAILGLASVWIQKKAVFQPSNLPNTQKIGHPLILPLRSSLELIRRRKDFAKFQYGFMFCGFGIMLLQPALPFFFMDRLHISYTDLAIALSICKGLGFVFSSHIWGKSIGKIGIMKASSFIFAIIGLFPLFLMLTPYAISWLYIAYFIYGIAQGGSHIIWNLSGPIFAKDENSSLYTNVNILTVGLRGMVAPPLGSFLAVVLGPIWVLALGVLLCLYAGKIMLQKQS